MNKKYLVATTLMFSLLCSAACSNVVGAYSDDPYGPVVNCDADLPMDKLLQCIDEKYAEMDKIHQTLRIKERSKYFLKHKRLKELSLDTNEISYFPRLKNNTLYDRSKTGNGAFQVKEDKYKNLILGIFQSSDGHNRIGYKLQHPFKEGMTGNYIDNIDIGYGIYLTRKYTRSYWAASKDVLITVYNNKRKLYAGSYEIVPLNNNKALYIINISTYCQRNFSPKEIEFAVEKGVFPDKNMFPIYTLPLESKDKSFDTCGNNYLYFTDVTDRIPEYIHNYPIPKQEQSNHPFHYTSASSYGIYVNYKIYPNKIINLSADRRENPTKIYVNLNNHTFEISLSREGDYTDKQS